MTFLVPKFTMQNYQQIMTVPYQGSGGWWSLKDLVHALCTTDLIQRFGSLDARKLDTDLVVGSNEKIMLGGVQHSLKDVIIAMKLLIPSLWTCDYFFWNVGGGTHTGVDIILPQGTPLVAFIGGTVTRIKHRDGVTSNEGNCVVIKDTYGYFRGYEHLESIDVSMGQTVQKGAQIGTCGSTGNSTQYHLHLQVDKPTTNPNPHRSSSIGTIQQKTIDPLPALRAAFSPLVDLPYDPKYQQAIALLFDLGYIQGYQGHLFPEQQLQRYEMALILHRMLTAMNQYANLSQTTTTDPTYSDVSWGEPELDGALRALWQYSLMKGYPSGKFGPFDQLLYEQALALLGRSFFGLQDLLTGGVWYQPYLQYFQNNGYLNDVGGEIGKPILRKDLFLLVYKVVK